MVRNQGEIYWIYFDPTLGHEQKCRRPAVVVSNNSYNSHSSLTLVCPISRTDSDFPAYIKISKHNPISGKVLCDQIRSVDLKKRDAQFIGVLDNITLQKVLDVLSEII